MAVVDNSCFWLAETTGLYDLFHSKIDLFWVLNKNPSPCFDPTESITVMDYFCFWLKTCPNDLFHSTKDLCEVTYKDFSCNMVSLWKNKSSQWAILLSLKLQTCLNPNIKRKTSFYFVCFSKNVDFVVVSIL
jgi:hypothetical protein